MPKVVALRSSRTLGTLDSQLASTNPDSANTISTEVRRACRAGTWREFSVVVMAQIRTPA
jgi:hypothetical protein